MLDHDQYYHVEKVDTDEEDHFNYVGSSGGMSFVSYFYEMYDDWDIVEEHMGNDNSLDV